MLIPRYTTWTGQPVFFMQVIHEGVPSYAAVVEYGRPSGLMAVVWDKYFPYITFIEERASDRRKYQLQSTKRRWHRQIVDYLERCNGRIGYDTAIEWFNCHDLNNVNRLNNTVEVKSADGTTVWVPADSAPRAALKTEAIDLSTASRIG